MSNGVFYPGIPISYQAQNALMADAIRQQYEREHSQSSPFDQIGLIINDFGKHVQHYIDNNVLPDKTGVPIINNSAAADRLAANILQNIQRIPGGTAVATKISVPVLSTGIAGPGITLGADMAIDVVVHPEADGAHRYDVAISSLSKSVVFTGVFVLAAYASLPEIAAIVIAGAAVVAVDFIAKEYILPENFSLAKTLDITDRLNYWYDKALETLGGLGNGVKNYLEDIGGRYLYAFHNLSEWIGASYQQSFIPPFFDPITDVIKDKLWDQVKSLLPVSYDPLILDLDGDGIETVSLANSFLTFDMDVNGFNERTAWVGKDDGILFHDLNNDGFINNGGELFGDRTIITGNAYAHDGFAALADLDSNNDGIIDNTDTAFNELGIVRGDGQSFTLKDLGIKSIDLNETNVYQFDSSGNMQQMISSYTKTDNSTHDIGSYLLSRNPLETHNAAQAVYSDEILETPYLRGVGDVNDIYAAIQNDETGRISNLLTQFSTEADSTVRKNLIDQLLPIWTETEGTAVGSRGSYIDAQQLAVLQKFMAEVFPDSSPSLSQGNTLKLAYYYLREYTYAQLMVQTHLKSTFELIGQNIDPVTNQQKFDLSNIQGYIQGLLDNPLTLDDGKQLLGEVSKTIIGLQMEDSTNYLSEFYRHFAEQSDDYAWIMNSYGKDLVALSPSGPTSGTAIPDLLVGTSGNEQLDGGLGCDAINAGAGNDYIHGEEGNDLGIGGDGNDNIYGGAGDDHLIGDAGNDTVDGDEGNDYLEGRSGNDVVVGHANNDTLIGGTGDDRLYGNSDTGSAAGDDNDTYIFSAGDGNDTILDWGNVADTNDTIIFDDTIDPSDVKFSAYANDLIITIGTDSIRVLNQLTVGTTAYVPGYGSQLADKFFIDYFKFEKDGSTLTKADIIDQLYSVGTNGGSGNDDLYGSFYHPSYITGGAGNDSLTALSLGSVSSKLFGGSGNDYLFGGEGDDLIQGDDGNDWLEGGQGNDTFVFASGFGTDTISDPNGNNTLDISAFSGNQTINLSSTSYSNSGSSVSWGSGHIKSVITGAGNDTITGTAADNMITGGAGDDSMDGGSGNDTYKFASGFGTDTISDATGVETLDFSAFTSGVSVDLSATTFTESIGNTVDWTGSDTRNLTTGTGNDTLTGSTADNTLTGGKGDDRYVFAAGFGDDTIVEKANEGIDTVDFSAIANTTNLTIDLNSSGSDEISDGSGNTVNWANSTIENVIGGDGADTITGSATANKLTGGLGDDSLSGGDGDDVYAFADNFGQDTLVENANEGSDTVDLSAVTQNLTVNLVASGSNEVSYNGSNTLNWSGNTIENAIGGSGNDTITGSSGNNKLTGGSGADSLTGGTGNDTYVFANGFGIDTVVEGSSDGTDTVDLSAVTSGLTVDLVSSGGDEVYLDSSNKINWANSGIENITTGSGNDSISGSTAANIINAGAGNDTVTAGDGNDTLDGGLGNDSLAGGNGDDTYANLTLTSGSDTINDSAGTDSLTIQVNQFQATWTATDANSDTYLDDLTLTLASGNEVTIKNYFDNTASTVLGSEAGSGAIESIVFNDATLDYAGVLNALAGNVSYTGTENNDTLRGFDGNDTLDGASGNDYLTAGDGNNVLVGGQGNDTLESGDGDDTFVFDKAWGADTITDTDGVNTIDFRTVLNPLTIDLDNNSAEEDTNSVTWTGDVIQNAIAGVGNDSITGNDDDNFLSGRSGNDSIVAMDGDDTLDGGIGNDTLNGGAGNNVYTFSNSWGADSISGDSGFGTVDFSQVTSNLSINLTSSGSAEVTDTVNTVNWASDIIENAIGGRGNDTITGSSGANVLQGNEGNDSLAGGSGNDTYVYRSNDGQDTISDASGSNTLSLSTILSDVDLNLSSDTTYTASTGNSITWGSGQIQNLITGDGNDTLAGSTSSNTLAGGLGDDRYEFASGFGSDTLIEATDEGTDTIDLSAVSSTLTINLTSNGGNEVTDGTNTINWADSSIENVVGGSGNDSITGSASANQLAGGAGNDTLIGGNGDDTYIFANSFGQDSITENTAEGSDTLDLSAVTSALIVNLAASGSDEVYLNGSNTINWSGDYIENVIGGSANDTITGNSSNNKITGGQGNDSLSGGSGNDSYTFAAGFGTDTINDASGSNTLDFSAFDDTADVDIDLSSDTSFTSGTDSVSWGASTIDHLISGEANDQLVGNGNANLLVAGKGNDTLAGGAGTDTLNGGTGDDVYKFASGFGTDSIIDEAGSDILDLSALSSSVTLNLTSATSFTDLTNTVSWGTIGVLENVLTGSGNDTLTGDSESNLFAAGAGNDTISGGEGNDIYRFTDNWGQDTVADLDTKTSIDLVDFSAVTNSYDLTINLTAGGGNEVSDGTNTVNWSGDVIDQAIGGAGDDTIAGSAGDNRLVGGLGNDSLSGNDGNDYLQGDAGDDVLNGGAGNDTYYFAAGFGDDTISDASGLDVMDVSYSLSNLTVDLSTDTSLTDGTDSITWSSGQVDGILTGEGDDTLTGSTVSNILKSGAGNDTLDGDEGNDTLSGGDDDDTYLFSGNWGKDYLEDSNGIDTLDFTGTTADITVNLSSSSNDEVSSGSNSINWFGDAIENVVSGTGNDIVKGSAADNYLFGDDGNDSLSGFAGADTLIGDLGNDTLVGGAGSDSLSGGSGNDRYIFANGWGDDIIIDTSGTDTVDLSNVTSNLTVLLTSNTGTNMHEVTDGTNHINWASSVIDAVSTGFGNDTITGSSANDTISAGAGNDVIDGGSGDDSMLGGGGNDYYYVNSSSDVITENANEGSDTVEALASYTLSSNVEKLILAGSGNIDGTGNSGDNELVGNTGNNSLTGGGGNDRYTFASSWGQDSITDSAGIDTVDLSALSANLTVNLTSNTSGGFNEVTDGTNTINWASSVIDAVTTGSGNDAITGNSGSNTIIAGAGNDTIDGGTGDDYLFGGQGNDYYFADSAADIITENASEGMDTVETSASYTLSGNVENLILSGSSNINGTGNSLANELTGNTGNNTLSGGTGNDTYHFSTGSGSDTISDSGNTDQLLFDGSISQSDVALWMNGSNLEIGYVGNATDKITVLNQSNSSNKVEHVELSTSYYLSDSDINQIIQDMNTYATNNSITITSLNDVKNDAGLLAIVNGAWHT